MEIEIKFCEDEEGNCGKAVHNNVREFFLENGWVIVRKYDGYSYYYLESDVLRVRTKDDED